MHIVKSTKMKFESILRVQRMESKIAGHVYEKIEFKPIGEISNEEIVMRLGFE